MEKNYTTTWVKSLSEMPANKSVCPKCGGTIYTSKFGGVYCNQCKWKWRLSDFVKKEELKTNGNAMLMEEMVAGFKEINERLDKLISYVVEKLK